MPPQAESLLGTRTVLAEAPAISMPSSSICGPAGLAGAGPLGACGLAGSIFGCATSRASRKRIMERTVLLDAHPLTQYHPRPHGETRLRERHRRARRRGGPAPRLAVRQAIER